MMTRMDTRPRLPFPRPGVLDPAPMLARLQAAAPVTAVGTAVGDPAWLVTGYAEARALFADPRLGRSHPDPDRAARFSRGVLFAGPMGDAETEPADHARMRRLLAPAFSARRMRALTQHVAHAGRRVAHRDARPRSAGRPARGAVVPATGDGDLRAARRALRGQGAVPGLVAGDGRDDRPRRGDGGDGSISSATCTSWWRSSETDAARTWSPTCSPRRTGSSSPTRASPGWPRCCCSPGTRPP